MSHAEPVQIFLEDGLRASAEEGRHNFLNLLKAVLKDAGYLPIFARMTDRGTARGKHLVHMKPPAHSGGLVFRRVYHYPFWQIEQQAERWHWDVAQTRFDPAGVSGPKARGFQSRWRERLFPDTTPTHSDAIYIPLQGKITQHRAFQSCSPLDMVGQVMAATDRPVLIGLHPKEVYSERDLSRLRQIGARATIQMGGMQSALPACHMVVTQNSSVAFNGYFFDKPALLFAQIDFHHIAQQKTPTNLADVLENPAPKPYAKYLHWFWQEQSINAGRPEAKEKIRARLARFGWL